MLWLRDVHASRRRSPFGLPGVPRLTGVSAPPGLPPPGWYTDPADRRAVRWWDGIGWTYVRASRIGSPSEVARGTHRPDPKRVRGLRIVAALTLVAIPVNLLTIHWVDVSSQTTTVCNAPLTWDQSVVGLYLPLFFVAVGVACLVASIAIRSRGRYVTPPPVGAGTIALSAVGLIGALLSGFVAATSMAFLNWCF
jgi:hypothetical protein